MPSTAIITLRALNSGRIKRSFHCLMHPLFLAKIAEISPLTSETLHNSPMMNAFSISPVMGFYGDFIEVNQSLWVRFGLLNDQMEDLFLETLEKGLWAGRIRLENFELAVECVFVGLKDGNPWCNRESFESLLRNKNLKDRATITIDSPMAFKRGDLHYPLPEPNLIFKNLARRWNLVAPVKMPDMAVEDDVSFSRFRIKTQKHSLRKGGTVLGSTGKLVLIFKTEASRLDYYNTLLKFSFYSGIGVKTSQGMGLCRVFI